MNNRLPIYEAELGQTSKGVWYCKSVKVSAASESELRNMLQIGLDEVETACENHNQPSTDVAEEA